jgi:hypothetical protein
MGNYAKSEATCKPQSGLALFSEIELKLLRLALDRAAFPGEAEVAGAKLIFSWRRRGIDAEAFLGSFSAVEYLDRDLSAARGRVWPYGKFRGKTVGELRPSYIRWALSEFDDLPLNLRKALRLVLRHSHQPS